MTSTSVIHKPRLPEYKILRVLCSLMFTVHISTMQHARLTTIIHNIHSITLHTSTHHPIKTHHSSKPSQYKHIFITTCLSEPNPNLPTYPMQRGVTQVGGIVVLIGASRSQYILPSSSNNPPPPPQPSLKFPLALLKFTFIKNF